MLMLMLCLQSQDPNILLAPENSHVYFGGILQFGSRAELSARSAGIEGIRVCSEDNEEISHVLTVRFLMY